MVPESQEAVPDAPEWPELMTVGRAAKYLGISRDFLYDLMSGETFPVKAKTLGKTQYFSKRELDRWLEGPPLGHPESLR